MNMPTREYTKPIYDIEVNGEILLKNISGEVHFGNGKKVNTYFEIYYSLLRLPSLKVLFTNRNPDLYNYLTDKNRITLVIDRNKVKGIVSAVNFNLKGKISFFNCEFIPHAPIITGDKSNSVKIIKFHLLNFPFFYCIGMPLSSCYDVPYKDNHRNARLGGVLLEAMDYEIHFHSHSEYREIEKELRRTGGYGITHIGKIKRMDEGLISFDEVDNILNILHYFLSFTAGRWCPPVLITGIDDKDNVIWEVFETPLVTKWVYSPNWFDIYNGSSIHDIFPGFVDMWKDDVWKETLEHSLYWYLLSNTLTSKDAGIILSFTALDRLKSTYLRKNNKHLLKNKYGGKFKIDSLLKEFKIDPTIPSKLSNIKKLGDNGPKLITEVRNSYVHPTERIPSNLDISFEAWQLTQWYLDLIFLKLFDYNGQYSNRITSTRYGQVEDVPWI